MASVDMMPAIVTQLQLLEATGQSLQHKDLLWEFFEQQVVPAIQMYQMQSAPNCCPDEPTLSTGGITWLASLAGKEEKGRERREGEE